MNSDLAALPDDSDTLKAALLVARGTAAVAECTSNQALIAHLKLEIRQAKPGSGLACVESHPPSAPVIPGASAA